MKTQKINLFNVGFSGFSATEADLRDGTVGHVNYALSQIDLGTGADTDYNARGRVLFNVYTAIVVLDMVQATHLLLERSTSLILFQKVMTLLM